MSYMYVTFFLQIFEDSIRLQSIWTNAREQLEKGELKTPENSSDEEDVVEEKPVAPTPKSTSKSSKKSRKKKDAEPETGEYFLHTHVHTM